MRVPNKLYYRDAYPGKKSKNLETNDDKYPKNTILIITTDLEIKQFSDKFDVTKQRFLYSKNWIKFNIRYRNL